MLELYFKHEFCRHIDLSLPSPHALLSREKEKNKLLLKLHLKDFQFLLQTCKELVSYHLHFHNRKNAEQTENQHVLNPSEN